MADRKKMTDWELATEQASHKPHTTDYILCEYELQRRLRKPEAFRSWLALGIAAFAVLISFAALIVKTCPW